MRKLLFQLGCSTKWTGSNHAVEKIKSMKSRILLHFPPSGDVRSFKLSPCLHSMHSFPCNKQNIKDLVLTLEVEIRKGLTWRSAASQKVAGDSQTDSVYSTPKRELLFSACRFNVTYMKVNWRQCKTATGLSKVFIDLSLGNINKFLPSIFTPYCLPLLPTHLFSGRRPSVFPQFLGWKTTASSGDSLLQNNARAEWHHLNGRLLRSTVLILAPKGAGSSSERLFHHCKNKEFQYTWWLQNTRTTPAVPPFQRIIKGQTNWTKTPKLPLLFCHYSHCKTHVPQRIKNKPILTCRQHQW